MEMSAKTFDDLVEGFLRSTWSTAAAFSNSDVQAVNADSEFTTSAGDFTTEDITVGQWVYVDGFESSDTNGWYKVTAIASGALSVTPAPPDDTNSESNTITIEGSYIRNGTGNQYYAFQLEYLDLTDKLRLIQDAKIGQFSLTCGQRSIMTGSFNFMGCSHELATSKAGDGTVDDSPDTEVLNTVDHITGVYIDGALYDGCVTDYNFTANFNARRQTCVGQLASSDIALGALDLSGGLTVYLTDDAWSNLLTKYDNFTKMSLAFPVVDADGNGYVFEIPNLALTNEPGNVPGPNEDVMLAFDWEGEPGTIGEESKTIQISRRQVA